MTDLALAIRPDDEDPRMCLPFVTLQVNGVDVEALVDSGAAHSQLVEQAAVNVTRPSLSGSAGAFGTATPSKGRAAVAFRLGKHDAGVVDVDVVPDNLPGDRNLIGQDVLARFRCTYRLADGVLSIDPEPPTRTHRVHLDQRRHVYLDVGWDADAAVASAVFDTGASVTVVDQSFARAHPALFTPEGMSAGMDATGRSVPTPMAIMCGPRILGAQLADALVAIVDLSGANSTVDRPMDLILGWTLLSQAHWYIDHLTARAACLPVA